MKRVIAVVALILVVGSIPPGLARHRSVGIEDQVVAQEDEPTVPNDSQASQSTSEADTPYEVGTTHPSECVQIESELSSQGVQGALTADEYCGELVYNEAVPNLTVISTPDQDVRTDQIATFDVVRSDLVGFPGGLTLCWPFCPPAGDFPLETLNIPGGNQRHQIFYDNMAETGLTNDSEETDRQQRQNRRNYGTVQLAYPNAASTAQSATGLWEMNGWVNPNAMTTYVAFLQDGDGKTIGPDRLAEIMGETSLPEKAKPKVCGFTEDRSISSTKSDALCELELKYFEPEEDPEASFTEYGDRCTSPTYMCNEFGGAAWRASPPAFYGSSAHPESGSAEDLSPPGVNAHRQVPIVDEIVEAGDGDSFVTWHWVVAPSAQACAAQEPGVALQETYAANEPYLAHDLDSYVPITRLSNVDGPSEGSVETYAREIAGGPIETVRDAVTLPGLVQEAVDNVTSEVDAVQSQVTDVTGDVAKDHRVEPNANASVNPFADSSQSNVELSQSPMSDCQEALTGQTEDTVDPWVDVIDSQLEHTREVSELGETFVDGNETLYENSDADQDDDNNPGPTRISTAGNVGLFTDNDDDGIYDDTGDPFRIQNIAETGAYPMIWNVKVNASDGTPAITGEGSCSFTDTDNTDLSLDAQRLGYGPQTGLFQLVYLQEPTAVSASVTGEREVFPAGNNIYLLASQSVRNMTDLDFEDTAEYPIEEKLDASVNDLQDWVRQNTDVKTEPNVFRPGDRFGFDSDFGHQCLADTGEFDSKMNFVHDCHAVSCEGDTVVTRYVFEITTDTGNFNEGGGNVVPAFEDVSDRTADFGGFESGVNVWTDVDPLDGNPDRNDDGTERPPTS